MNEWQCARRHNLWLAILAASAFAISQRSIVLLIFVVVGSIASWLITNGCRRWMLPRWIAALLTAIVAIFVFLRIYPNLDPTEIPSAIGMGVSVGIVIRLYSRQSVSDERQVLMLAGVLIVAAALQSADLLVGIFVISGTLLAVDCVVRFRLLSTNPAQTAPQRRRDASSGNDSAAHRRLMTRNLNRIIRVALALVLVCTAVIFVVLPRNPRPTGALFGIGNSILEFPDEMSLFSPQRLAPSRRELMHAQWLGPDGESVPHAETLRLRGVVLDRYDPGTTEWFARRSGNQRVVNTPSGEFQSLADTPIDERLNTYTLRVHLRALYSDVVFSPWAPVAIRSPTAQVFTLIPGTLAIRTRDFETAGVITGYDLRVQPFASESTLVAMQDDAIGNPPIANFPIEAVHAAAVELLHGVDVNAPSAQADSAARWARNLRIARIFERELTSDRFRYTLDLRSFVRRDGRDPIDLFLNEYRFGHCEYFASALCALCQSVGVDARIVTGFLVSEFDNATQRYIVRESDGHAWVEVRTSAYQWTMIDATPMGELGDSAPEDEMWAQVLRFFTGPLESFWRDEIASFDSAAQSAFLLRANEWIRSNIQSMWSAIERTEQSIVESTQLGPAGAIWIGSVIVATVMSSTVIFIGYRRRRHRQHALGLTHRGHRGRARARLAMRDGSFYVDALDLLDGRGMRRPINMSPRAFADTVRLQHAKVGDVFAVIVDRFYSIRFGGQRPDSRLRAQDHALVEQLRAELSLAR